MTDLFNARPFRRALPAGLAMLVVTLASAELADAQTRFMYLRGQTVHPAYEGWTPNEDGSFDLWFGYMNSNWEEELDVKVGPNNHFSVTGPGGLDDLSIEAFDPAEADRGQPSHFYPRRNPFLFTVRVPSDFGERELVWTLRTQGDTQRAYGSLRGDYRIDPQVISTEVGGDFGSLDDQLRSNIAPEMKVDGGADRRVRVGEPMTLTAWAVDPDNYPPRSNRSYPQTLDQLYRTSGVGSVVASGAPGLRMSWTVYRGPARQVTFEKDQLKAWMDTRAYGNSPWSPPYVLPEVPDDHRWTTDVTFHQPGEYVLRAVAGDGSQFTYHNVNVTVTP